MGNHDLLEKQKLGYNFNFFFISNEKTLTIKQGFTKMPRKLDAILLKKLNRSL